MLRLLKENYKIHRKVSMLRQKKTFALFYWMLCLGTTIFATTGNLSESQEPGEMIIDFLDEQDPLGGIDIDQLRSVEESFGEPEGINFEMALMYLKLRSAELQSEFRSHFEQHSNEYLLGSACIATTFILALCKQACLNHDNK